MTVPPPASPSSDAPRLKKRAGFRAQAAFTLLEMLVALAAFAILMAGIFAITQGTLELSNDLGYAQDRSAIRQNFISFLRRSFRNLPGEAEVRLAVQQRGGRYLPNLNVINGGSSFTPGASRPPDTSVDLFVEERPGGFLRVGIRLLDARQTSAQRAGQSVKYSSQQVTMPLLDNVTRFEWRFFNSATNRWENNWKDSRKPIMAEMSLQLDDGFETRAVFWLPPILPNAIATATPPLPGNPPALNPDGTPVVPPPLQPSPAPGANPP